MEEHICLAFSQIFVLCLCCKIGCISGVILTWKNLGHHWFKGLFYWQQAIAWTNVNCLWWDSEYVWSHVIFSKSKLAAASWYYFMMTYLYIATWYCCWYHFSIIVLCCDSSCICMFICKQGIWVVFKGTFMCCYCMPLEFSNTFSWMKVTLFW